MYKTSDKVRLKWPIPQILMAMARFAVDNANCSYYWFDGEIIAAMNPMRYTGKPRLGTIIELLGVMDYVSSKLIDMGFSFIVMHGSAHDVEDPKVNIELYELAKSEETDFSVNLIIF